jgi:propanediol utilization protein
MQNVAAGVVGIVVWPVWFAMDAKGAPGLRRTAARLRLSTAPSAVVAKRLIHPASR